MKKSEKYAAIHIGPVVDKSSVASLQAAILKILESSAGDDVKKAAITALSASFSVNGSTISNCQFSS